MLSLRKPEKNTVEESRDKDLDGYLADTIGA